MCGIAGILNQRAGLPAPSREDLAMMVGALRHRGPDEAGIYRDRHAGLGHARLAIIDLASGQQPMCNETGRIWISFNGEVFNYIELRRELEAHGHRFRTRSDTEVIIHAYEQWGTEAFRRFNGQWAVALWDAERRVLVLARDPYGVRPLYVAEHLGRLFFASEVKAIFAADRSIVRSLDPLGLDQLFTFWTTIAPRTLFSGIQELEPGTVRTYSPAGTANARSWDPTYPPTGAAFQGSLAEAAERVRAALEEATALRMLRADVPVGAYLSGGLDSSLIAALALRAKTSGFSTFSLRFDDLEYDESEHQRAMVAFLGSDHHEIRVGRADIARVFPEVIRHTERPVLRTAAAPLYLLARSVRSIGTKVVVTGEGADEMFAGYDLFREAKVRRYWARNPESVRRPRLLERLYPYMVRSPVAQRAMTQQFFGKRLHRSAEPGFGHLPRWESTAALKRLFGDELRAELSRIDAVTHLMESLPTDFRQWSFLAQDQYLEVTTLLSGYLLASQGDRMLMAHSVEGRFPFLDREVAALADSLPAHYKLRGLDEKHVLKRAARPLVPASILARRKQPYRAPDAASLVSIEASEWLDEVCSVAALQNANVFGANSTRQLIEKCRRLGPNGRFSNADNMAMVGVASTQLLHHQFVASSPRVEPVSDFRTVHDLMQESAQPR